MMGTYVENGGMVKKRKPAKLADRHKPSGIVRLPKSMTDQLDALAERNATDRSELVRNAVREYLEARDLWPPK